METQEAAVTIFYESEAPTGFLRQLQAARQFDYAGWQRLWQAVAQIVADNHGVLDDWTSYDLTRIVVTIKQYGMQLEGRSYDTLDDFEQQILSANLFINEVFGGI